MWKIIKPATRGCFVAVLLNMALFLSGAAAQESPTVIYMSVKGSNSADGRSPKAAVGSLQTAVDRAKALLSGGSSEVEVWIDEGRYTAQQVAFEGLSAGKTLIIRSLPKANDRPVFDGEGEGGTWFVLQAKNGEAGNVQIFGLKVTNYVTAVSLAGTRDAPTPRVVNVVIRNNLFARIGQIAFPEGPPSTAAIRLVNADNVQIINNVFDEIKNIKKCGVLHALYIAHNSTNNVIEKNTFEDSCGDAIRFRDGSSDNRVVGNRFVDAWAEAPITDWYCDSDTRGGCTKKTAECPSYSNLVEGNTVQAKVKKGPPLMKTWGGDHNSACRDRASRGLGADKRFMMR